MQNYVKDKEKQLSSQKQADKLFQSKNINHHKRISQVISKINFQNQLMSNQQSSCLVDNITQKKYSVRGTFFKENGIYKSFLFQNKKKLIYFFACRDKNISLSNIVIWQFKKQNGKNKRLQIKGIKGQITAIKVDNICTIKTIDGKQQLTHNLQIICGTKSGYLKCISIQQDMKIRSCKLCSRGSIVQIIPFRDQTIKQNVFYLVLIQNNQIFLVNIKNFNILVRFNSQILAHQVQSALNICHNQISTNLIYQATKTGYLLVWDIEVESVRQLMKKSIQGKLKDCQISFYLQPKLIFHQLSLDGLLYMRNFGMMVFIVDIKGQMALYSIDLQDRFSFIKMFQLKLPYWQQKNKTQQFSKSSIQKVPQDPSSNQTIIKYLNRRKQLNLKYEDFRFDQNQMSLYYLVQKQARYIYKIGMNQWMQVDRFQKIKIKNEDVKEIESYCFNRSQQFVLIVTENGFCTDYVDKGKQK